MLSDFQRCILSVKVHRKRGGVESVLVLHNKQWYKKFHLIYVSMSCGIADLKSSLRKIEHENADLKFLNNQYVHKIRQLEKESKSKTDKIVQLQEKNFHAVVQTPGTDRTLPQNLTNIIPS